MVSETPRMAVRPARKLRKCIATVALSGTLPDKLEAAAAVGFDGVEIMESDLLSFDGSPADVRRICADLGLAIDLYQPFRDFEAMPEPQRARNIDRAERKFDVMQALGTDLTLVCSNTQPAAIDDDSRAAADLAEMAERAARRGLRVGYEALSWARHVNLWGHAWRIVQQAAHPALGLIVDSFHTLSLGDDPSGIALVPAEKLFFVQMADAPKLSMDVLSWSRHFRNFPGQGDLDVIGFMRAVLASGYTGPLSLEVFNDDFRAAPARLVARDGLRSLILTEAEATDGAGLPATPVLDGVAFLEFAVDETARQELAGFLQALGFRHAGRHRSKSVDLYRQGGVNLVLNAEQDSAAAEHFQLHGVSVCAMAIRVDDTARTLERARALLCPEWQEPVGAGERQIPAVRAPDGTLVYLVQPETGGRSFWEDDFDLAAGHRRTSQAERDRPCGARLAGRAHGDLRAVLAQPVRAGAATATRYAGPVWPGAEPSPGQSRRKGPAGVECLRKPRNGDRPVCLGLCRGGRASRGLLHARHRGHGGRIRGAACAPSGHAAELLRRPVSALGIGRCGADRAATA